ncbi:response regulator [Prosthecobacter vanneervenii]|uniref:DNA-binding NarL/FixJ family response regulator n=1 Tax=Prosthecobacter vanneervenii TaxID=48466 RepID=A0A7W8DKJ1_9BACT|nr:response regulator transcription factor [Prosthecobacter vanneervenii]MBB5033095.1 DNA-binding NarL/FixJ family response regulator [Prosthecobacter vanneervenii]
MNTVEAPARTCRIMLVDDHPAVINGYRFMLQAYPQYEICGTATNEADAISLVTHEKPDLIITDLNMPGRGGLELIKDLAALHPGVKIVVSSMHDEMLFAARALRAGACGYVSKDSPGNALMDAIARVIDGGVYVSDKLAAHLAASFASPRPRGSSESPLKKLSDREFQVFELFGHGKTAKEIAAQLHLSPKTVSVHRDHIKEKMGFVTSAEMIRQAVRWVETQREVIK